MTGWCASLIVDHERRGEKLKEEVLAKMIDVHEDYVD